MITALWIVGIIFLYLVIGIIVAVLYILYDPRYSNVPQLIALSWVIWLVFLFLAYMGDLIIWIRNKIVEKREKKNN